jgi:hypothetical protein
VQPNRCQVASSLRSRPSIFVRNRLR